MWVLWKGRSHVTEKGQRERGTQRGIHKNISLKPWAWKTREVELLQFLQTMGFKVWRFKGQGFGRNRAQRRLHCFWREGRQTSMGPCGNSDLKMPGTHTYISICAYTHKKN